MSRIAKAPVPVPADVTVEIDGQGVTVKGKLGTLHHDVHRRVAVSRDDGVVSCAPRDAEPGAMSLAATTRALIGNMVHGVNEGFERKLELVGVGYRAQMQGATLNLALGFAHPVNYEVPEGVTIETPTQTEIRVRGIDKQAVGQVAATIRGFRPPEPYKGKGVKYAGENIVRKEAKKK